MSDATARPTRPALPTLQRDQRALIDGDAGAGCPHGLRNGFPSRRAAIEWFQRATVRTVGRLAEHVHPGELLRDRTFADALVRRRGGDHRLSATEAASYRLRFEREVLLPACNAAYNELRGGAGEYVDREDEPVDPDAQKHVAMRPGFQEADDRQHAALTELWDGFESVATLQSWLHGLDAAANGAIERDLAAQVGRDAVLKGALVGGGDLAARRHRERFALLVLLPAFARGVRRMEAGELAMSTPSDGLEVVPG